MCIAQTSFMELLTREKALFALLNRPEELQAAVVSMTSTAVAEKRQKLHWEAKVFMLTGNLPESISRMSAALTSYGPHVGLRADLATCYYLLGIPSLFEKTLLEIKNDYFEFHGKLHPVNQARSILILGKLFEEAGFLDFTFDIYKRALKTLEQEIVDPIWINDYQQLYLRIFSQILRFNTQFEFTDEAKRIYGQLVLAQKKGLLPQANDDIYHALFLYGLRMHKVSSSDDFEIATENLSKDVKNLCYFEQIEFDLRFGRQRISKDWQKFPSSCIYDRVLQSLYQGDMKKSESFIRSSASQLPKASVLRSLYLFKVSFESGLTNDLISLFDSLLFSLPMKDREIWNRWIEAGLQDREEVYYLSRNAMAITNGSYKRRIDLEKKIIVANFLNAFSTVESLPWEDVAKLLWGRAPESSDFDRLRMLVKRTNDLLSSQKKCFELKDFQVVCKIKIVRTAA